MVGGGGGSSSSRSLLVGDGKVQKHGAAAATGAAASLRRQQRRQWVVEQFTVKKARVYEGCRMLSKDGRLLAHIDARKLQWYLSKGLAELVSDDNGASDGGGDGGGKFSGDGDGCDEGDQPRSIRLLFDHKVGDQSSGADAFYASSKRNACVVCGEPCRFLRYRVVPACYRRFLPASLKVG